MSSKFKYILLVDDDHATNFIHERLLKKIGCSEQVLSFKNGSEAYDFVHDEILVGEKPILILLDINMPVMNGWEFLTEFNALPDEKKSGITIAMVTTSPDPADRELAKINHINHYLGKPLKRSHILRLVEMILEP